MAEIKISQLPAATSANGTMEFETNDSGTSKKVTGDQLKTYATSSLGTISTQDANNVTITGGSINSTTVGGTTAAAGKFTTLEATGVTTVSAGTNSAPAITTTGDTNTGIFFPSADTVAATTGGTERMRIDSSGNVGIGTTAPTTKLTVNGSFLSSPISSTSFYGGFTTVDVSQGISGTSRYLLLVKKVVGGGSCCGTIVGKRTAGSSEDRRSAEIKFNIRGGSSNAQVVNWSSDYFSSIFVRLVTLDYDDGSGVATWFAIDPVATGASAALDGAVFYGMKGAAIFQWIESAVASNVVTVNADTNYSIGNRVLISSSGDFVIGNGNTNATPTNGLLRGTDGSGTDIAGATLTIRGGQGTGAGAGGPIVFSTSAAGTTGTTLRTAAERMRIDSAGNVGLGVSDPSTLLDIGSSAVRLRANQSGRNQYFRVRSAAGTTSQTVLQLTIPATTAFVLIKAFWAHSRASAGSVVGTSRGGERYFSIGRNGSGSDVVLNDNFGTQGWVGTSTTAGGTNNAAASTPAIARNGTEANTDPQVVNITYDPNAGASVNGSAVFYFEILALCTTDIGIN